MTRDGTSCLGILLALGLTACTAGRSAPLDPTSAGWPVLLSRHPELVREFVLPPDSRGGVEPPEWIPVRGPWTLKRTQDGVHSLSAPLPMRPRALFFLRAPTGMHLEMDGDDLPYLSGEAPASRARSWSVDADTVTLRTPGPRPPAPGAVRIAYDRANERERSLNRRWSGLETEAAFAFRSLQQGEVARTGALLPAPARVTWTVTIPPDGHLWTEAGILEPEVADLDPSDGATLVIRVQAGDREEVVTQRHLSVDRFEEVRADLSSWAGQEVLLSLETTPGAVPTYDYVFAAEPTLYTPQADPPRMVLLFVDTLRRDHVGFHGYERPTTPAADALAARATVFDDARSAAPWTLPSVRSILLGDQPEGWLRKESLPERLAKAGWTTGGLVGNVYLSANFDMEGGWSWYHVTNWPRARQQVDRVRAWNATVADRPTFEMIHFMDIHVPYLEPLSYQHRFARTVPPKPGRIFVRSDVVSATSGKDGAAAREYVKARYDGSLRYVDDQISRLLADLDEDDTIVFFSDHGEEFWDHNGFEHGHTLFDELLRVPLVIASPSLPQGRVTEPVCLTDLAATLLDLAGVDRSTLPRWADDLSLVPLARGDAATKDAFTNRKIPFGRPLYGDEQWGVLAEQRKYTSSRGNEALWDLVHDPGEQRNLARKGDATPLHRYRDALAEALGWPVHTAFRLEASRGSASADLVARLTVPGGIRTAWVGADATMFSEATVTIEGRTAAGETGADETGADETSADETGADETGADETAVVTWLKGYKGTREVFVVPNRDAGEVASEVDLVVSHGKETRQGRTTVGNATPDGQRHSLASARAGGRTVTLTWAVVPEPPSEGEQLKGYDPEVEGALKALGYMDEREPSGG